MLTQVSSLCNARNVVSGEKEKNQRMRETLQAEDDNRAGNRVQNKERRVTNANNQRPSSESFSSSNAVNGQLERIKIPVFGGNKLEFPRWQAAFSSCVDSSSLSAQFKMLRLEGCLAGEAAETVKGLGYSEAAYETAKGSTEEVDVKCKGI